MYSKQPLIILIMSIFTASNRVSRFLHDSFFYFLFFFYFLLGAVSQLLTESYIIQVEPKVG